MQGHRPDGMEQGAASRGEVSGSPRYGAPVTTGHDKQQGPSQALGGSDRGNVSSAQVHSCQKNCAFCLIWVKLHMHANQSCSISASGSMLLGLVIAIYNLMKRLEVASYNTGATLKMIMLTSYHWPICHHKAEVLK